MAVGRLYASVTMDYEDGTVSPVNTTYKLSQTFLWVMSEVTCTFLVFCVPALPKFFSDQGIISRITASWRFWTPLPRQSSSERQNRIFWPRNTRIARDAPRETGRQNGEDTTKHVVFELNLVKKPAVEHFAQGNCDGSPAPHIV